MRRKELFVSTVNPAVADFAGEDFSGKSAELWLLRPRSHILKIMEAAIFRNKVRVERFEQDAAVNLRGDQIPQPCGSAPGSASHENAFTRVRIRIDMEATTDLLNGSPVYFSRPESYLLQLCPLKCLVYKRLLEIPAGSNKDQQEYHSHARRLSQRRPIQKDELVLAPILHEIDQQ